MATKNLSAVVTFASTPSYSKTIWQGGDLITDIRLNNMEQGIENASSTVNATQANTTKAYVLGRDASSGAGMDEAVYDSGVYLGESSGTLYVDTTSFPAICATRSGGNAGNISIETVAGARDIWFGVGGGGSNRGIYDQENSKWLVYFDSNNEGHLNGGSTSADSLNVSDAGSAQTPVYFKDGVPVACSFSGGSSGSSGNGNVYYGTCSTSASTAEKVVTLSGSDSFSLETGAHLIVNFTHNNSADNPTLNVNSVGAKSILGHNGSSGAVSNVKSWIDHSMVEFVYDGTYWVIVSIGCKSTASGLFADAVCWSTASGNYSHSEGYTTASGDYSHSEGYSIASGECSHSEGGWIDSYPAAKGFASHVEGADTVAEGDYAHAEGGKNTASGTASHAEGYDTTAGVVDGNGNVSGNYSHAEGICGTASGTASHVEGGYDSSLASVVYNEASGGASHAEGCGTIASGNYGSHAEGRKTEASGIGAHAEGHDTVAIGDYAHTEGDGTETTSAASHAEGYHTSAGYRAHAEGNYSKAEGYYSHAEGTNTLTSSNGSHAEGRETEATANYAHAEGYLTYAQGVASHTEGYTNYATEDYAHAEGNGVKASGTASHAEGYDTTAGVVDGDGNVSGNYSHAEGICGTASGTASHVEGGYDSRLSSPIYNEASGGASHAEGCGTIARGNYGSHAEGQNTLAQGVSSHAEGYYITATGDYSHAEGYDNNATGDHSHVEGFYHIAAEDAHAEGVGGLAYGEASHVEGGYIIINGSFGGYNRTSSDAYGAHAEGASTQANNTCAHAEGVYTVSSGYASHSEGYYLSATGSYSHAEGWYNTAIGVASHAEGADNIANGDYTHAQGYGNIVTSYAASTSGAYNNDTEGALLTIGNGSSNEDRSNALRVTSDGETYSLNATNNSGADYAEFIKPWADGNTENEDRVGYFVTVKDGMLYKAEPGEYIAGITSGNPSVVGNSDETYYWRYERDEFNRLIWEEVNVQKVSPLIPDTSVKTMSVDDIPVPLADALEGVEGGPLPSEDDTQYTIRRPKQSENYDISLCSTYVPRKERSEWDYVGMIGVLPVRDDGTCEVGRFCKCGEGGIATLAEERGFDTYMVIERKTDNVVSVILK